MEFKSLNAILMVRFLVVEFPDEVSEDGSCAVAIISSRWVQEETDNLYCFWPDFKNDRSRIQSVLRHTEVQIERCNLCRINIKYETSSFEKAKEKLKLLEIQSDVDVTDTESARKKVGVRHLEEYVSDIDSEGEDLPVIKLNNKPIIKPSKPHLYQASKFGLNSLKNTKPILSQPKNNDSQNMCQNEIRTEGPSGSEGSLGISSGLSSSSYERLEELLVVSIKKQEKIERHMEYIIQLLQKFHPDGNLEELREMDIFPLGTPDELINMNDKLLADSNNHEKTVSYLKLLGGKDGPDTTRRILRKIMTNDLSNNINWSGRGGKPAFKEFNGILKVINESVRGNPLCKNTSEKEVESIIKIWLRGSCDRDGGRNLRRN